jgi:hypothetical protein
LRRLNTRLINQTRALNKAHRKQLLNIAQDFLYSTDLNKSQQQHLKQRKQKCCVAIKQRCCKKVKKVLKGQKNKCIKRMLENVITKFS